MSSATLSILGDATGVRRALGDTVAAARRSAAQIQADSQRASSRERTQANNDAALKRQLQRQEYLDRVRTLKDKQRADEAAARARAKLEQAGVLNAAKSDRQKTANAAKESQLRLALAAKEVDQVTRIKVAEVQSAGRLERDKTRLAAVEARQRQRDADRARAREEREEIASARRALAGQYRERRRTEREEQRRQRDTGAADRQNVGYGLRLAGAVGGGALDYATTMDRAIQGARRGRAGIQHTLNDAFYQAGATTPEDAALWQARILQRSRGLGQDPAEVAGGLLAAQSQFNVLAPQEGESRMDAVNRNLDVVEFAANSRQSPAELLRVAGVLGQQRITGADQRAVLMSLTGMAQAGGVELSNLSAEALGPLMQNIARGTNAGMTPAQRSAAVRAITAETVGISEVASRGGLTAIDSTRATAKFRSDLTSGPAAERYWTRLHESGHDDVARSILATDARGHHTFQAGLTPVELMSRIQAGFHGDAAAAKNVLGAGGGSGRQAMDSQQLRLFEILSGQGGSIRNTVGDVISHGADFTDARLEEGRRLRESEDLNTIRQNEADNTSALRDLYPALAANSDAINNWRMRHPWLDEGGQAGAGALGKIADVGNDVALGAIGARAGGAVATGGVRGTVARVGARIGSGAAAGGRRLAGGLFGPIGLGVLAGLDILTTNSNEQGVEGGGALEVQSMERIRRGRREAFNARSGGSAGPLQVALTPADHAAIGRQTAEALRGAPITATVQPAPTTSGVMPPTPHQ